MVVHATSPKPLPSPLARVVVAPLQMRNFNVKTPSSLWTLQKKHNKIRCLVGNLRRLVGKLRRFKIDMF